MKFNLVRSLVCAMACGWVMLVPPGLSYYWLIDPEAHAEIDAGLYGQTPDGRTLPGYPERPPHEHPASAAMSVAAIPLASVYHTAAAYDVFASAQQPWLGDKHIDAEVIAESAAVSPLERPPRA